MRKTTIFLKPKRTYQVYTNDIAIHWKEEGKEPEALFFHPKEKVSFKAKGGGK